jgi:hypothetical protein
MSVYAVYPATGSGGGGGGGTVTSIDVSGGTTGLTTSGGPVTGAGTITFAGTVNIAHGGTGQTTANAAFAALSPMTTAGDLIFENATPLPARLAIGTAGQVLTVSGGLPAWSTPAGGVSKFATNWPNASGTTFVATHNLGTTDVQVSLVDLNDNNVISVGTIVITSSNVVTLTSSEAPNTNWRVIIIG